jgi:hypothetical protein
MPAGAAIVGGSVISGMIGADAAGDAARTQAGASRDASQVARQTALDQIGAQAYATAPGRNVGTVALYQLASMMGIDPRTAFPNSGSQEGQAENAGPTASGGWAGAAQAIRGATSSAGGGMDYASLIGEMPRPGAPGAEFGAFNRTPTLSDLQMDPSYGFRLLQNLGAIENSAAARGMQLSGSTLKDLSRFSQDYASQEYGNAYGRFMGERGDQFNRLASLAGIGQSASQATGANAAAALGNMGNQVGSNILGAGNAMAAGQVGAANAINSGINSYFLRQALSNGSGGSPLTTPNTGLGNGWAGP